MTDVNNDTVLGEETTNNEEVLPTQGEEMAVPAEGQTPVEGETPAV